VLLCCGLDSKFTIVLLISVCLQVPKVVPASLTRHLSRRPVKIKNRKRTKNVIEILEIRVATALHPQMVKNSKVGCSKLDSTDVVELKHA
jgi:hypothetical protein